MMIPQNSILSDEYYTPKWVYKPLGHFDLDPCAGPVSSIAQTNYRLTEGENGLQLPWGGFIWLNPPFSQKEVFIAKMKGHRDGGILLLPDRCSAPWFGQLAHHCGALFIMGKRINFINSPSSNAGGSALFPFGDEAEKRLLNCGLPGMFMRVEKYTSRDQAYKQIELQL